MLTVGVLLLICSTYDNLQSMQKEADIEIPHLDIDEEIKMLEAAANKVPLGKADLDKPAVKVGKLCSRNLKGESNLFLISVLTQ